MAFIKKRPKKFLTFMLLMLAAVCAFSAVWGCGIMQNSDPKESPDADSFEQDNMENESTVTETSEPMSTEELRAKAAEELISGMSLEEKVYQLFILTPEQLLDTEDAVTEADSSMQSAFQSRPVGGVVLFADNIISPEQTTRLISDMQSYSRYGLFAAVDEEGGTVARLGKNKAMETTLFPPMGDIGATGDTENARNVGLTIGKDMMRFGFNLDFAPIADVNSNPDNPVIGNRAFSTDPEIAADMVSACVAGFRESGVMCTLKHFPGHGDTKSDSHYGEASVNKTLEELRIFEFLPFQAGIEAGADTVMVGHISLPEVTDDDMPASMSYDITTGLLRKELGFDGLIVTDSMSMKAVTSRFSSGEAAVRAILAGVDIILMPESADAAANGILDALENGEISEDRLNESVYRIICAKLEHGIIPLTDD